MATIETKIFHVQALHYSFLSNLISCHLEQQSENSVIKQATAMEEVLLFRVWQRLKPKFSTLLFSLLDNLISWFGKKKGMERVSLIQSHQ